jgi:hypothetical protein
MTQKMDIGTITLYVTCLSTIHLQSKEDKSGKYAGTIIFHFWYKLFSISTHYWIKGKEQITWLL